MAIALEYDKIIKYQATAVCREPLHVGSAVGAMEEVLVHPVDEIPFIQASSIAGVFRDYFVKAKSKETASKLFGARNKKPEEAEAEGEMRDIGSRVRFTDGTFLVGEKGIMMELRPRLRLNSVTGTCDASIVKGTDRKSGHKFNVEYVGAGAKFVFTVYLYDAGYQNDVEDIFAALSSEDIQFGGQKSNGCGYVRIESLKRVFFDMTKEDDRKKWGREDMLPDCAYEDITASLLEKSAYRKAYEITVEGRTEEALLVKGIVVAGDDKNAPDAENIKNAMGDYIIPGSSLKGAVRSQMEKIAAYLGKEEIVKDTFGVVAGNGTKSMAGNISFYDTVVGDTVDNNCVRANYRIHINKFTGGVMEGALFSEKNVHGNMELRISISDKNAPQKSCGLLLLALRDLAIGTLSIGSGYSVGKGIVDVDTVTVLEKAGNKKAVIDFKNKKISDENKMIDALLAAVRA